MTVNGFDPVRCTSAAYFSASCLTSVECSTASLNDQKFGTTRVGDLLDCLLLVVVEDDLSEQTRGGIVHVNDDVLGTGDGLKRPMDQVSPGGRKNLFPSAR